jgi:hypothetical protein
MIEFKDDIEGGRHREGGIKRSENDREGVRMIEKE